MHRWCLEVWKIDARPGEDVERAVSYMGRRVTFDFQNTPLDAAIEMLAELTGVTIEVKVPNNLAMVVTARMREVTLGAALNELLAPLELRWSPIALVDEAVKITTQLTAAERALVEQVTRLLAK